MLNSTCPELATLRAYANLAPREVATRSGVPAAHCANTTTASNAMSSRSIMAHFLYNVSPGRDGGEASLCQQSRDGDVNNPRPYSANERPDTS